MRVSLSLLLLCLKPLAALAQDEAGFALPPLSDLSAMVERPLFVPSRRGTEGAAIPLSPGSSTDRRLIGIVKRGGQGAALLLLNGSPRTLTPGQVLEGWRLIGVEPGAALLSHTDGRHLRLTVGKPLP